MGILLKFFNLNSLLFVFALALGGYLYLSTKRIEYYKEKINIEVKKEQELVKENYIAKENLKSCESSINFLNLYEDKKVKEDKKIKKVKRYVRKSKTNYIDFYNLAKRLCRKKVTNK